MYLNLHLSTSTPQIVSYLNLPEVRSLLGIAPNSLSFTSCNEEVNMAFNLAGDVWDTSERYVAALLEHGVDFLVYAGKVRRGRDPFVSLPHFFLIFYVALLRSNAFIAFQSRSLTRPAISSKSSVGLIGLSGRGRRTSTMRRRGIGSSTGRSLDRRRRGRE